MTSMTVNTTGHKNGAILIISKRIKRGKGTDRKEGDERNEKGD